MLGVLSVPQARKGYRLQSGVIDMNLAGAANAFALYQVSNFAQQIGTKSFRIKRIKGQNYALVNTLVHIGIGVGVAFVDSIPPLLTMAGLNFDFTEADLPEVEWFVDMTAYPVVANVLIQVEVEQL